ncbi:MAG: FecR domain-containing protein [Oligoflexia bacterium]|nr:FecR domain-containing protein [Oligoflexia bacterium]
MYTITKTVIIFFVICVFPVSGLYAARVASCSGTVEIKKERSEEWQKARRGMRLLAGDLVKTSEKSNARLEIAKGYTVKLGPDSTVAIRDLGYVEKKGIFPSVILFLGEIYTEVKSKFSKGAEVHTQTCVIGVRGTKFTTRVAASGISGVKIDKGEVDITSVNKKKDPEMLPGGSMAVIDFDLDIKTYKNKKEWEAFLFNAEEEFAKDPGKLGKMSSEIFDSMIKELETLKEEYGKTYSEIEKIKHRKKKSMENGQREDVIAANDEIYVKSFDLHNLVRKTKHIRLRTDAVVFLIKDKMSKENSSKVDRIKELSSF